MKEEKSVEYQTRSPLRETIRSPGMRPSSPALGKPSASSAITLEPNPAAPANMMTITRKPATKFMTGPAASTASRLGMGWDVNARGSAEDSSSPSMAQ